MMHKAFDSGELAKLLSDLGRKEHLAFGAACCERLIPNYKVFQQNVGWGEVEHLRAAVNAVWDSLPALTIESQGMRLLLQNIEKSTPDSEEFDSLFVASAQDACFSVCSLIDYLLGEPSEKIVLIAQYCIDSIDLYVQETEEFDPRDPDLERKILTHPLMQAELERQDAELSLVSHGVSTQGAVTEFRSLIGTGSQGNLGV